MFKKKLKPNDIIDNIRHAWWLKTISKGDMLIILLLILRLLEFIYFRILFVIASIFKLVVHQMDVKIVL
jgi:hypothetical protein